MFHDIRWTGNRYEVNHALAARLTDQGRPPVIPYGVSNPLGAAAYARPSSRSHGNRRNQALHQSGSSMIGVDIDAEPEHVEPDVLGYTNAAAQLMDLPFDARFVEVVAGQPGGRPPSKRSSRVPACKRSSRSSLFVPSLAVAGVDLGRCSLFILL
jgi:hypothetical protein